MDNRTVFAVTLKGEGEIKNLTHHLSENAKHVLLLVDDQANIEVLARRTAPSLRAELRDLLRELEQGGFIQDKAASGAGGILRIAVPQTPSLSKNNAGTTGDLDFTSDTNTTVAAVEVPQRVTTQEAHIKTEQEAAEEKQQAETARHKAEEEAVKARAAAEAARLKAEQEAARIKAELELAQAKAAAEARARAEAQARAETEAQAKQAAEAARLKAEQEAANARIEAQAKARIEAEAARLKAEQEIARIKAEAEEKIRLATQAKADAEAALAAKTKAEASAARSMIATVLFFDVVGYTKQSVSKQIELKAQFNKLVSEFIHNIAENQRIILDTGDGAAIGFLQHPEDAIEVALKFRRAVSANQHRDYPDLKVRIGIHLGPVNIVKDMNGQSNMVGDGINDAQRIMSFAPSGHIYISRSYYDVVSRLSTEYAELFQYRGIKNDKHGRQHQVYEASNDQPPASVAQPTTSGQTDKPQEPAPATIRLEPFILQDSIQTATAASTSSPGAQDRAPAATSAKSANIDNQIAGYMIKIDAGDSAPPREQPVGNASRNIPAASQAATTQTPAQAEPQKKEARQVAEQKTQPDAGRAEPTEQIARQQTEPPLSQAEQEAARAKAEREMRQMAEEQSQAWAAAAQRAKIQATVNAESVVPPQNKPLPAGAIHPVAHARRRALPLGKMIAGLLVLLLVLIPALPYVWPMQNYLAQLESKLSAQLQQPVHIAHLRATLLPLPKLELQNVSVGGAQELKAANVILNFDVDTLFTATRTIRSVEINDLELNADSFLPTLSWLQAVGADAHYPVAHMVLKHGHINAGTISLPTMNGDAAWDSPGHFSKALLSSENGKLEIELQARQARWQIALHLKDSNLPWLPDVLFGDLDAQGETGEDSLDFSEIDGHLYGGKFKGSAQLNWRSNWQMKGRFALAEMDMEKLLPQSGNAGEIEGDGNFHLSGATLPQLADAPYLEGSFKVKNGVLDKMDMVETARLSGLQSMAGGRTHFDELNSTLQLENNSLHLRQIRITSGVLNARGTADISADKQLSGRLVVDIKMRAGSVPLALSGTLADPLLRPAN